MRRRASNSGAGRGADARCTPGRDSAWRGSASGVSQAGVTTSEWPRRVLSNYRGAAKAAWSESFESAAAWSESITGAIETIS